MIYNDTYLTRVSLEHTVGVLLEVGSLTRGDEGEGLLVVRHVERGRLVKFMKIYKNY